MALFGGPSQPVSRLEELKRLLQRDPTSRQFLALAEEYRRHGKYRDAVITLERGLAMHQNSVAGHVALGKTYQQLDRLEDAIRAFTNALRIDRENLVAIRQLAEVYLAKGDKVEAIKKLKLYRGLKAGDREVGDIIARLEQEMSAAVGERPGFRSGATRPAVEAPPGFPPRETPPVSGINRRAALLRRLEISSSVPVPAAAAEPPHAVADVPPPPPYAPPARGQDPLELTYDRSSMGREDRGGPLDVPPPPPPPPPSSEDVFAQAGEPEPPPPPEIPPYTAPIETMPSPEPPPFEAMPAIEPPPPPQAEPGPAAAAPRAEPEDMDDAPTKPFEFPAHLYRVGAASATVPPSPSAPPSYAVEPEPPAFETVAAPPRREPPAPEPIVTETLASLYEKQGFAGDAREAWETLAAKEPDAERAGELQERAAALPAERTDRPHLRRLARRFPRRTEATAGDLQGMIRALVESTEGIRAATLTDLEGLPVVMAGPGAREGAQEILVAELTTFLKSVGRTERETAAGGLRAMTLAGAHGTAVVARVNDDYSLILRVDPDAILGEVRWEAERTARALRPAVR